MLLFFSIWSSVAAAADVRVLFAETDFAQILIQGAIEEGDGAKFYAIAESFPRATVALDSPGGVVSEALSIGAEIAIRGYTTYTGGQEASCYSACALIWVSGIRRYMTRDAVIGVHAAYRFITGSNGDREPRESGAANAEIGAFLNELGLSRKAIQFFTTAGPEEFQLITPEFAQILDIDVYVQDGFNVEPPAERPTPRKIADTTTQLLKVATSCAPILDIPSRPIELQGRETLQNGHAIFGGEIFAELIVEYTDRRKAEIEQVGLPGWCIEADLDLRESGIQIAGLVGPSFDCGKAASASERTICRSPELWARDRILSTAYLYFRGALPADEFANIQQSQRAWLKRRESCGSDLNCTKRVYSGRLRELGLQ